jgi:MazG family protein
MDTPREPLSPEDAVDPTPEDRRAGERFAHLVAIMRQLRGPDGCPWDREQDFRSLRRFTLEEAYEVVQAIDDGDRQALAGELGDLLLQVVFLSQMGVEEGSFCIDDTIDSISTKLVRRHPHVFGDLDVADADEVLRNWEAIKRAERAEEGPSSLLDDVPQSLPALERAQKLGKRATQLGFDWSDAEAVLAKVREEVDELEVAAAAGDRDAAEEELGDLLLAITSLARHLGVSAELAANGAAAKFEYRFRQVEIAVREGRVAQTTEAMEAEWQGVKLRQALASDDGSHRDADEVEAE